MAESLCAKCVNFTDRCTLENPAQCISADFSHFTLAGPKISTDTVRDYNVGASNYSQFPKGYQPWDLWKVYHLNPWDADILKRLLRTKTESGMTSQESRKMDYEKIIHICRERINQINEGYEF